MSSPATECEKVEHRLKICRIESELTISDLDDDRWASASPIRVINYWSGQAAPESRRFTASLLWSDTALYIRFAAARGEDLVIRESPVLTEKTLGLWDRDTCEIFVAPARDDPGRYFEFEVAPTGEWVDLAIEWSPHGRRTDTTYQSNMAAASRIEVDKIVSMMKIGWEAFGRTPAAGDVWLGNIFRCVGRAPDRGYLAWRPTLTREPNFHMPDRFGEFEFMPSALRSESDKR